jgi:hypothetical protein
VAKPVYVDLVSGSVYDIPDRYIERHGTAAILKNLPIWDAPVVVTDRSLLCILEE